MPSGIACKTFGGGIGPFVLRQNLGNKGRIGAAKELES